MPKKYIRIPNIFDRTLYCVVNDRIMRTQATHIEIYPSGTAYIRDGNRRHIIPMDAMGSWWFTDEDEAKQALAKKISGDLPTPVEVERKKRAKKKATAVR